MPKRKVIIEDDRFLFSNGAIRNRNHHEKAKIRGTYKISFPETIITNQRDFLLHLRQV